MTTAIVLWALIYAAIKLNSYLEARSLEQRERWEAQYR